MELQNHPFFDNMPESATVEEVENIYLEGWKLGLVTATRLVPGP